MEKYQFFISSTYEDLKEERNIAINIVMKQHQIPAGMELFGAMGEEQWNYIKREIDESDYYLLILAGKYGSLNKDGISYTEAEYNYACETNKRIIAFLYEDINSLSVNNVEQDRKKKKKLNEFRNRVKKDKLVEFWSDSHQLELKISSAISNVMREYPSNTKWIHKVSNSEQNKLFKSIEENEEDNDEEDNEEWKFEETTNIGIETQITNDISNPSRAVMTGGDAYVVLVRRDGPVCSYMKHSCKEYIKLITYYNERLFTSNEIGGQQEILCIRKLWFDTKNPNVEVYIDYLYNYDIQPTYSLDEIKELLYNGCVLGDGQNYDIKIRMLAVNMYSDHYFENNKEFYEEEDKSSYIDIKWDYTKFEYMDEMQKRTVVANLEITNKSKNEIRYTMFGSFKVLNQQKMPHVAYNGCIVEALNKQGTEEFNLLSHETRTECIKFIAQEDIEKVPEEINVCVMDDAPVYE